MSQKSRLQRDLKQARRRGASEAELDGIVKFHQRQTAAGKGDAHNDMGKLSISIERLRRAAIAAAKICET